MFTEAQREEVREALRKAFNTKRIETNLRLGGEPDDMGGENGGRYKVNIRY